MSLASRLLVAVLVSLPMAKPCAAQAPASSGSLVVVLVARLNVRSEPRLDARAVDSAARGDTLCVVGVEPDWVEIRTPVREGDEASTRGFVARGLVSEARVSAAKLRAIGCGDVTP